MLQKQSKSDYSTIDELWNGLKVRILNEFFNSLT